MIFSRRFITLLLLGSIPFVFKDFNALFLYLGVGYNCLLFILCVVDYFLIIPEREIVLSRRYEENFSLLDKNLITIDITNYSKAPLQIDIKDGLPQPFFCDKRELNVKLPPSSKAGIEYYIIPYNRGDYKFSSISFRLYGRLGLALKQRRRFIKNDRIFVYPDISTAKKYVLFQRKSIVSPYGLRRFSLHGEGTDFESLRDYVPDDDIRWINWKATAKKYKPICKNFQIERSQNVIILIDCGRTMTAEINDKSRLDYVVDFAASVSLLAMEVGDKVGLITFSNKIKLFLSPQENKRHFGSIMDALYNLRPEMIESDYSKLFSYFNLKMRKRSLVLLFTELESGSSCDVLIAHILQLSRIHLPLIATVRDTDLVDTAASNPLDDESFFRKGIASQSILERERLSREMVRRGAIMLDLPPEQLSVAVLNKYLEIKTRFKL